MCTTVYPTPDWATIRTVLLDMDGTLLDRAFDDHFYLEALPAHYAAANRMPLEAARERLVALYRAVEGELEWTDIDYWARTLKLDVPAIKDSLRHRIASHPDSLVFLGFLREPSPVLLAVDPSALLLDIATTALAVTRPLRRFALSTVALLWALAAAGPIDPVVMTSRVPDEATLGTVMRSTRSLTIPPSGGSTT